MKSPSVTAIASPPESSIAAIARLEAEAAESIAANAGGARGELQHLAAEPWPRGGARGARDAWRIRSEERHWPWGDLTKCAQPLLYGEEKE